MGSLAIIGATAYRTGPRGVRILNAATEDFNGVASPNSISFDLSNCLYWVFPNDNELSSKFRYELNGVAISKTNAIPIPSINNPISQRWTIIFDAGTIAAARGTGTDVWEEGDVLTVELRSGNATSMRVRPDCVFANIDASDAIANIIPITPVENLYNAPTVVSASIIELNTLRVIYDVAVDSDGIYFPVAALGEKLYNCTDDADLPIISDTGSGSKIIDYTFTGLVDPGDSVSLTIAGVTITCVNDMNLIPIGDSRTFDAGIGTWTFAEATRGSPTWNASLQALDITNVVGTIGDARAIYPVVTSIGSTYTLTADVLAASPLALIAIGNFYSGNSPTATANRSDPGPLSVSVVATNATTYFFVTVISPTDGDFSTYDNVSIVES